MTRVALVALVLLVVGCGPLPRRYVRTCNGPYCRPCALDYRDERPGLPWCWQAREDFAQAHAVEVSYLPEGGLTMDDLQNDGCWPLCQRETP